MGRGLMPDWNRYKDGRIKYNREGKPTLKLEGREWIAMPILSAIGFVLWLGHVTRLWRLR